MKTLRLTALSLFALSAALLLSSAATAPAAADVTVKLTDVHICCGNCVKGVATALAPVTGVKGVADQKTETITLTAADNTAIQKAVNALTAAGYFGKSSDATIKVDATSGAKDGKAQTLDVTGVHLCCAACVTAVKGALATVDGVKGDTVAIKATSFTLTGDFDQASIFAALHKIGVTGKVATTK